MTTDTKNIVKFLSSAFIGIILMLSFALNINTDIALAQPSSPNPVTPGQQNPTTTNADASDDDITCAVDKIGWIVCPLMEKAAWIGDQSFQFLSKTFLETEPELVATYGAGKEPSGTYKSWELARNIANVMFIAAFLIIILSQVTGRGLDNYGIKKMLPRLIIAAVAVNVSYFICQAMVDLSNILGYEVQNFLVDMARDVSDRTAMPVASDTGIQRGTGTLAVIAGIALASVVAVWLILSVMIPAVGVIVITVITLIIILLMRKAFIILLVVVSPIAFVLYLLPNTEQYFRKWLSMFWKLLMVFPVIGLLFGAGQLASAVILVAGTSSESSPSGNQNFYSDGGGQCITLPSSAEQPEPILDADGNQTNNQENGAKTGSCGDRSTPVMLGLVAALIAVAPMLAVWSVLKTALQGAGAIGGKISGAVDTYTNKGVNKAGEGLKGSSVGKGWEARKQYRKDRKSEKYADKMSGTSWRGRGTRILSQGVAGNIGRSKLAPSRFKYQNEKLAGQFAGAAEQLEDKDVQERQSVLNRGTEGDLGKLQSEFKKAMEGSDVIGAKAAENLMIQMGQTGTDAWLKVMKDFESDNPEGANSKMSRAMQKHTRFKHPGIKSTSLAADNWATSNTDKNGNAIASLVQWEGNASTYTNASADHINGQSKASLQAMERVTAAATGSTKTTLQQAALSAQKAKSHEGVKQNNKETIVRIAGSRVNNTPPSP